ncbi:MAG: metal-dependent hydrolase [Flexibacter sp. CG_4_10_14_3_um_filter_32_15]|nr:MAG: metal-dependent hydrolase [Flexibacter sp. CG_4_10_14_3_um_filter_32_15]
MKINYSINNKTYTADLSKPLDISIPLQAGNKEKTVNPNCYYAEEPTFETIRFEDTFVGSVAEGGVCNYQRVSLTPHGNGTHTECYGHLNNQEKENVTINQCLKTFWFVARLVSLEPTKITKEDLKNEEFSQLNEIAEIDDEVILKKHLEKKLNELEKADIENATSIPYEALIIRTLPNSDDKKTRQYSGQNPPYLEPSIGEFLAHKNINHLLLDLPSVDREWDKGKLSVHKGFWKILNNKNNENDKNDFSQVRKNATITELIFADNKIKDGIYLLNIQIPSLEIDAVPSKPVLYEIL